MYKITISYNFCLNHRFEIVEKSQDGKRILRSVLICLNYQTIITTEGKNDG
jgi:hypothetical protein